MTRDSVSIGIEKLFVLGVSDIGVPSANLVPINIEIRSEFGSQKVETDQVGEGHCEDHGVGKIEYR
jgi:hypothetical protein